MRRLYQRQGFALWILACATAAASAFTPAHAANGSALSRQVSISNLAIQSSPLLQKSYTPDGKLASLTDANNQVNQLFG